MFEFFIATGKFGVLGVSAVFIIVFLLAQPGKEISFWGIKFHKKYRLMPAFRWRRIPSKIPEEWNIVLLAFAKLDSHYIHENEMFQQTKLLGGYSELKTRSACIKMEKYGLVKHFTNYVSLENKAIPLANQLLLGSKDEQTPK